MKKRITIGFTIIYILSIIGIIEMYFDKNPNNDHIGSFLIMVMILVQAIHTMIRRRLEGEKKNFTDVLFVFLVLGVVIWTGSKFIM